MQVVVDGLLIHYSRGGSGPSVVCLHGWGDSAATFKNLAKNLTGYEILAPDLPGFGGSQAPSSAWGLDDYAKFVSAWLKKLDIKNVHGLIGHSFGGSVAIVGLGNKLLDAEKLVLLASSGVRTRQPLRRKILWLGAKILKIPLYVLPASKAQRIKTKLYKKAGSDLLLLPHMRQTFVRSVRQDVQTIARKISQPTLLIYGSSDRETPVTDGRILSKAIPYSKLEIIKDAGHFLHQEQTEMVVSLIKSFLGAKAKNA